MNIFEVKLSRLQVDQNFQFWIQNIELNRLLKNSLLTVGLSTERKCLTQNISSNIIKKEENLKNLTECMKKAQNSLHERQKILEPFQERIKITTQTR